MMNILNLQYGNLKNPYTHGGLSNANHEVMKRLAEKHNITVFTGLWAEGNKSLDVDGVEYIQKGIGKNKYINRLSFSIASKFFKITDFDLVIVEWDRYAPILIKNSINCPVVLELHLDYFSAPSKFNLIEPVSQYMFKKKLGECNYLMTVSQGIFESVEKYLHNIIFSKVIYNGIDENLLSYSKTPTHENYLLFLGRLDIFHKGLDVLIESYARSKIDIPLKIVGDGLDKMKIKKIIREKGLEEKIEMLGYVSEEEKYELLHNCLAVCMPSRVEGFPLVAMDAAALGKPVIGTRVVGLVEAVVDGKTGLLVEKDNIQEFATAIRKIVENKELRSYLGKKAKARAKIYTWKNTAKEKEDFFHRVVEDFEKRKQFMVRNSGG